MLLLQMARNSPGGEIVNVNFFTTTPSTTTFTQRAPEAAEFDETTQNKGHYAVKVIQSHRFWYKSKGHIPLLICD